MVLLRILQALLRLVLRLLYELFVLVMPQSGEERVEPHTQRDGNICLRQRRKSLTETEEFNVCLELKEKKKVENQLRGSENTVTALQEKAQLLSITPPPPPPPPLHPLVLFTSPIDPLDALRKRKTFGHNATDMKNVKDRAMDETMEIIKKGVSLRPIRKPPQ